MNIRLHIDRVVLDGLEISRLDAESVRQGLEVELTHLLQAGGVHSNLRGGSAIPSLRVGTGLPESNPDALGTQVAQAVYGGIGGENPP